MKKKEPIKKNKGATYSKTEATIMFDKPIGNTEAKDMIKNFKIKPHKFKDIVWAEFDRTFLTGLCNDVHVLNIKFFIGVAPVDTVDPKKSEYPLIMMQVKRDDIFVEGILTTGYNYYSANSLCPPPNDGTCGNVE